MLEINKTQNGLTWSGSEKLFTNNIFTQSGGYEILDNNHISIELDNQVYCLGADGVIIDGQSPTASQDLVNIIFG